MQNQPRLIPIYTSQGALGGFLAFPYIFDPTGEWIGWVAKDRKVYSVHGHYVGTMTNDPRILRPREWGHEDPMRQSPAPPEHMRVPTTVPLAPQMPEIPLNMIDVLEEAPELMPPVDFGELREDMD
jgi:hypothetical protein